MAERTCEDDPTQLYGSCGKATALRCPGERSNTDDAQYQAGLNAGENTSQLLRQLTRSNDPM